MAEKTDKHPTFLEDIIPDDVRDKLTGLIPEAVENEDVMYIGMVSAIIFFLIRAQLDVIREFKRKYPEPTKLTRGNFPPGLIGDVMYKNHMKLVEDYAGKVKVDYLQPLFTAVALAYMLKHSDGNGSLLVMGIVLGIMALSSFASEIKEAVEDLNKVYWIPGIFGVAGVVTYLKAEDLGLGKIKDTFKDMFP